MKFIYTPKRKSTGSKYLNSFKAFLEINNKDFTQMTQMIFIKTLKNKTQVLIVFGDVIADMLSNKKLNPTVIELLIRGRKLNISLVFIAQYFFSVPKNIRLNSTQYFIMKIPNKRELQQIAFNRSSDIDFQDFLNPCNK